jgi:alpha-tubulin suppressor-like RCC1 family protein
MAADLLDLPVELFADICQQLDLRSLVHVAATCRRIRHGDGRRKTAKVPTKSPVVTALLGHAFARPELVPRTRPSGCSDSWVAYLARCARQRRCLEAPPFAAGKFHSLYVDAAGQVLACGEGAAVGHGDADRVYSSPASVAALAGIRVRSVAAVYRHSLALSWDGRVYVWGDNCQGQLGLGDRLDRPVPTLVEGLKGLCGIAAASTQRLAMTQSGVVYSWGPPLQAGEEHLEDANTEADLAVEVRPEIVKGLKKVRVSRVCAGEGSTFAIGAKGELFSWGRGEDGHLGHGDKEDWGHTAKRVEALRGVRISSVSGWEHAYACSGRGQAGLRVGC